MSNLAISAPPASSPAADAEMQPRIEQGADPQAVNRAFDAIDAVFAASPNPELTRQGLRGYVDMVADAKTTPAAAIEALTTEHDIHLEEWDTSTLDPKLRDGLLAHYLQTNTGERILVVPAGQDPAVRLAAVRTLLAHQGVTA
ncbi:hypothetical protein [Streptomyces sp. T028]|uniref:hypothetical protein n=1 Tax=Streptomyces sp. T028 TaxID=3394379 RepID=UPI003A855E63